MAMATPEDISLGILSGRTLNIKDLNKVIALLERHNYSKGSYNRLSQHLNLPHNTLEEIKKDHKEAHSCFTECLASWLRKPDGVDNPTIDTLIAALRGIGENAVADGIERERQSILTPAPMVAVPLSTSDEPMVATPPTSHTSEGHSAQSMATVNPGVADLEQKIDQISELKIIANHLEDMYDLLVLAVKNSLKDHHIDVKDAKMLIESCFRRKARIVSELMPYINILEKANDFESFFKFLIKYDFIGYLNYKLLKKLAGLVKDGEIKKLFFEYEKEYAKLLSSASFQDFIPLFEEKSNQSPTALLGLPCVSFRLERPWLFTVVYTWVTTFGEFSWSYYALLDQLRQNCVIITYAILPCVLDDVIRDLKDPVVLKRLEDKGVTVIEIIEPPQKEEVVHDAAKNIKDLEDKLKQYERDLEDASNELKIKDELCQKSEECIKEKDRLIRKLMEKLETKEAEMRETKTTHAEYFSKAMSDKASQIAQLMKRIMLLEEKLKKQIEEAKEKLEEEQRICREKIEEANINWAQRNKEAQCEMEEQLQQIVRQESSQVLALKGAVSALTRELATIKVELMNIKDVATDVRGDLTDMKSGMKQAVQEIKETQRQMFDKMNEKTEELSKKIEQGTAFRDEVQSMNSRLKDEMAAKMDEQAERMTEKIKTDIQEAIITYIIAPPEQGTTYSFCEVDENPHDQETSHHILSSSSSNCGIVTYSMQETHDILREDPTIASKVFSGNIDIKERAIVDLTRLADKLKAKKIISQGDRDKAVDGYTKQTEAQRRGELIDRVHENLKCGIGEAFEIFLDILREEDTRQLNKLVADLERSYDEIGGSGGGAKVGSEAKPQYILTISDLEEVVSTLQKHHFTTTHWDKLCLSLGILYNKLRNIEDNHPGKVEQQFQEGISLWLRLQYDYEKYGEPTWRKLVNTLEKINERAVAEGIRKDKLK